MKKYLFRILVGLIAFGVGISFVWLINISTYKSAKCDFNNVIAEVKTKNEIEVIFKKVVESEDGLYVDFKIVNNSTQPAIFLGVLDYRESIIFPITKTKVNGVELNEWKCQNGFTNYFLKPGQAKTFRYSDLSKHWEKGKDIQIGFNFKIEGKKEFQTFWSENLSFDDLIISKLLKEQKRNKLKYGN